MARRSRKSPNRVVVIALALGALATAGWIGYRHLASRQAVARVSAERIDPANEGRHVQVHGRLAAAAAARDADMGIDARAAVLLRKVEMYQWRERCDAGAACVYETAWSSQHIDASAFRQPQGHDNPPMRLADARFFAAEIRLGAFVVDKDIVAAQVAAVDHPVRAADLPPNLAATFADANGALYAGADAAHPRVGEVRISYRIGVLGDATLSGVQRGGRLAAE